MQTHNDSEISNARRPEPESAARRWAQISHSIRTRYPLATEADHELRLVLTVGQDQLRIGIRITPFEAYGEPSILIAADLGPTINVDSWDALAFNALLSTGSLATIDQILVLRSILRHVDHDDEDVLLRLQAVAVEGAQIRQRLRGAQPSGTAFQHYQD